MKIYVEPNYQQQAGDTPVWNNGNIVEIDVVDVSKYYKYIVSDNIRIDAYKLDKTEYIEQCKKAINTLCDTKQRDAKKIIADKEVSTDQDTRYQSIAKHTRNATGRNRSKLQQVVDLLTGTAYEQTIEQIEGFSKTLLQPLADQVGKTIEEYADYIVEVEFAWSRGIDSFYIYIEEFRHIAGAVLEKGDFGKFWEMMGEAEDIGKSEDELTPEETIGLIRGQLDSLRETYL